MCVQKWAKRSLAALAANYNGIFRLGRPWMILREQMRLL
jgi:hypothetical protein